MYFICIRTTLLKRKWKFAFQICVSHWFRLAETKVVFKLHVTYRLYSVVLSYVFVLVLVFFIEIGLVMVFVLLITGERETEKKNSYKTNVVNNLDYHFKITITKNIFALLICQCTKKSDVRHIILYYRALAGLIMWQSVSELKSIVCIKQFISFVFVCYTKKPLELFLSCSCNFENCNKDLSF